MLSTQTTGELSFAPPIPKANGESGDELIAFIPP